MPKVYPNSKEVRMAFKVDKSVQQRVSELSNITGLKKQRLLQLLLMEGIKVYEDKYEKNK